VPLSAIQQCSTATSGLGEQQLFIKERKNELQCKANTMPGVCLYLSERWLPGTPDDK
jgi:hypothetical protein